MDTLERDPNEFTSSTVADLKYEIEKLRYELKEQASEN
jgi:hypothetical protein